MVSTAGAIVITIVVLLVVGIAGWVGFTQLRARQLGLPPPGLKSYLPWHKDDGGFSSSRSGSGGIGGWFSEQIQKFKNRNNRSATGAYEQPLADGGNRGRRGFGPLDPDEAWDTRVGHEADQYGYYEENLGGGRNTSANDYDGSAYRMNVPGHTARGYDEEEDRGRRASRSPHSGPGGRNPFDDDAATSLRGVSPRPMDAAPTLGKPAGRGRSIDSERRSVFREDV